MMGPQPASVRGWVSGWVRAFVHIFKHQHLLDQRTNHNQILSKALLGWGKSCNRFWCRSVKNSGFPLQQLAPILAGNKDVHEISDEFEI